MRRALLLLLLLPSAAFAQNALQPKRSITAEDLFQFTWIGDVQLSPKADAVAFVQTTVSPDHTGYQTALYTLALTPGATPHLLTPGTHDTSPRWSPDATHIAFLRTTERDGKPSPAQLYLTTPMGDSPTRLSDLPKGAGSPQWRPDGTGILVTSSTPQDQPKAKLEAAEKARATGDAAHVSDVRIVNRAGYRLNGEGNLDPSMVPQLYLVSVDPTQPLIQLTSGRFGVEDAIWHPGSQWLFYTSLHIDEPYYEPTQHNTLFALNMTANHATTFTQDFPVEARGLAMSPDGNHLAFHAQQFPTPPAPPVSHQESDLYVQDLTWTNNNPEIKSPPRNLTSAQGYEMGSGVGGDNTAPRGAGRPAIAWSADSAKLLDIAGSQGSALLLQIDATTGDLTKLTARRQAVLSFVASPDQHTIIGLISNPILIGDLFQIDPAATPGGPANGAGNSNPQGNQTQLTHVNDALFAQLNLALPQDLHVKPTVRPQDIPFLSIDTFVQLPPDFPIGPVGPEGQAGKPAPTRPYPMILNIHGGPHSAYGWIFDQEMQLQAARGYVVVYPNPRGSTTYGQRFANIIASNYPGDDFHDLMDTVDEVIKRGWADPTRLGVTGGSGGGLLTDWTVTQTQRFKAAVAQRDIVDQAAWWYTADIAEFHQYWMPEAPFDHEAIYRAHSPITFINNVKTPMMFILGDADLRTPPTSGGEEFFRYLKYRHIPTVMIRFPRESHELSRSGEPWHRIERLNNITNWFDKFLLNKPEPQYDIAPVASTQPAN